MLKRFIKVTYLILMLPATIIYGLGYVLGLADDSQRPVIIRGYVLVFFLIVLPLLFCWQSCELRPFVQRKIALEKLGYDIDGKRNSYINSTYEWLNEEGKFDTPELRKYKDL